VLTVRPVGFFPNPETRATNAFQNEPVTDTPGAIAERAAAEYDTLVANLAAAGIRVVSLAARADGSTPDAVFPNNWVSFHPDGTAVLYPMLSPSRRRERRNEFLEHLGEAGFHIRQVIDLAHHETRGRYLEGTGSVVLDRAHRIAYACLSARTDLELLAEFGQQLDFEILAFEAADAAGVAVYHTNVMMSVGQDFAVVCEEAIRSPAQREALRRKLEATGHEIVPITLEQMGRFAGNVLELTSVTGERILALSGSAASALDETQRRCLEGRVRLVSTPVPTIERYGGGSVRCMLAEIHLPSR
jgi:hypothetical protein